MQPFLSRSSRVSGPSCTIPSVVLSSQRHTPDKHTSSTTGAYDPTKALIQKFGGFYGRFYSAMSRTLLAEEPSRPAQAFPDPHDRSNICGGASTLNNIDPTTPPTTRPPPVFFDSTKPSIPPVSSKKFPPRESPASPTHPAVPATFVEPFFRHPANLPAHPTRYPKQLPLAEQTKSVQDLVQQIQQYSRIAWILEKEIAKKNHIFNRTDDPAARERVYAELEDLQNIYIQMVTKHGSAEEAAKKLREFMQAGGVMSEQIPADFRVPFPDYVPGASPLELNQKLTALFAKRPLPRQLLLKVCFNLLVSPAAPDMCTYNILVINFTRARANALAHMVFRSILEHGYQPDDYTIAAALNLGLKSSDYEFYMKIIGVIHSQRSRKKTSEMTPKEYTGRRTVAAAMITGAAKFGRAVKADKFLNDFRRDFPEAPSPGMICLTSLLFMWTKQKHRANGARVWSEMVKLDAGLMNQCEKLDLRAFHQMVIFCNEVGMEHKLDSVLQLAMDRGFTPQQVLGWPKKTKGLHLQWQIKVPRLMEISPAYWRFRPKDPVQDEKSQRRDAFFKGTEEVMTSPWIVDPPTTARMEDLEKYGDYDQPEEEAPPQQPQRGREREKEKASEKPLEKLVVEMMDQPLGEAPRPGHLSSQDRSDIWAKLVEKRLGVVKLCLSGQRSREEGTRGVTSSYKMGVEL